MILFQGVWEMSEFIAFILGTLFGSVGLICYTLCVASKGGDKGE